MGWKSWLVSAGLLGVYYLFKYSEWEIITGTDWEDASANAEAWVANGQTLAEFNESWSAFVNIINDFNDFMDDLQTNESALFEDLRSINPETGLWELPDLVITFPNKMQLKIIDGGTVSNFRINLQSDQIKGGNFPIFFSGGSYLCMRLKEDPSFEFAIPGTSTLSFIDDLTGETKPGNECVPPRFISDTEVMYLASYVVALDFIRNAIITLGLTKIAKAFGSWLINKRKLKVITDTVKDTNETVDDISVLLALVSEYFDCLNTEYFNVDVNYITPVSKMDAIVKKLKSLGYRPYG